MNADVAPKGEEGKFYLSATGFDFAEFVRRGRLAHSAAWDPSRTD